MRYERAGFIYDDAVVRDSAEHAQMLERGWVVVGSAGNGFIVMRKRDREGPRYEPRTV